MLFYLCNEEVIQEQNQKGGEDSGKMFIRALVDFILQEVVEWLMPSLDWTAVLKLLVLMLVLRLCAQVGCLSLVILIVLFLFI